MEIELYQSLLRIPADASQASEKLTVIAIYETYFVAAGDRRNYWFEGDTHKETYGGKLIAHAVQP